MERPLSVRPLELPICPPKILLPRERNLNVYTSKRRSLYFVAISKLNVEYQQAFSALPSAQGLGPMLSRSERNG